MSTAVQLTKSRLELTREVANKLRIVGTGQSLEPEYAEEIDSRIDPLLLQLSFDGICHVSNTEEIPGEWYDPLASLLANLCAGMKGGAFDPQLKQYYEMMLKRITSSKPTFEVMQTEYF